MMELEEIRMAFDRAIWEIEEQIAKYDKDTPEFLNGILIPRKGAFDDVIAAIELLGSSLEKAYLNSMKKDLEEREKAQWNLIKQMIEEKANKSMF